MYTLQTHSNYNTVGSTKSIIPRVEYRIIWYMETICPSCNKVYCATSWKSEIKTKYFKKKKSYDFGYVALMAGNSCFWNIPILNI